VLLLVSCGDSGARLKDAGFCIPREFPEGICKESPLWRKSGRRGVFGSRNDGVRFWSSFDTRSLIFGDGDSFGVESESDLPLEGLLDGVRIEASFGVESPPIAASLESNCLSEAVNSEKDFESMLARTDRCSPGPKPEGAVLRCMEESIISVSTRGESLAEV
jgi:hypothetical protein